jgi:hypothetical protein
MIFYNTARREESQAPIYIHSKNSDSVQINLMRSEKIKELQSLKYETRIREKLKKTSIQERILSLKEEFIRSVCSENPTAFWK